MPLFMFSDASIKPAAVITAGIGCASYVGYSVIRCVVRRNKLTAAIKQQHIQFNEDVEWLKLKLNAKRNEKEDIWNSILSKPIGSLQGELQAGHLSTVDVLNAFQWKALAAHGKTNCLTTIIREAEEWAEEQDKLDVGSRPPFFGIPVSLKASIKVKGYKASRGYAQDLLQNVSDKDAAIVVVLKKLGAIPFVQTNIPQSMLSFGSSNPVFGITLNPHNRNFSSGGSSSGEAALVAYGGSPVGVGTDVAGSIRLPSHYCGVYGIKPSSVRSTLAGFFAANPGTPYSAAASGPIGPSVDSLVMFLKALYCDELFNEDPYVVPLKFRCEIYEAGTPLRIGWYDQDGWFPCTSPCVSAVHSVKRHLEAKHHTLVKFVPPDVPKAVRLFMTAVTYDGGNYIFNLLENDICDVNHGFLKWYYGSSLWLKNVYGFFARLLYPKTASIWTCQTNNTVVLKQVYMAIADYRRQFLEKMKELQIDCILCPASGSPALYPQDPPSFLFGPYSYTLLYNVLDFAAGVAPVGVVSQQEITYNATHYTAKEPSEKIVARRMQDSLGLPVGVQVAAPQCCEEVVLRVMKDIEAFFKRPTIKA